MKLWCLRPVEKRLLDDDDPWKPWYDKSFGFVCRAETEMDARKFAAEEGGDENCDRPTSPWLQSSYSTCEQLMPQGEPGVVMNDFASA